MISIRNPLRQTQRIKDACNGMSFFSLCHTICLSIMTESLPLLSDFEKMLLDRIEDLGGRIHKENILQIFVC